MQLFAGTHAFPPAALPGQAPQAQAPTPPPDEQQTYEARLQVAHAHASSAAAEDNKRACQPGVNVPFADLDDAIARLLPYHVFSAHDEDETDLGTVPAVLAPVEKDDEAAPGAEKEKDEPEPEPKPEPEPEPSAKAAEADVKSDPTLEKPEGAEAKAEGAEGAEAKAEEAGSEDAPPATREVLPTRSRAQAWAESRVDFVRAFQEELESKRRRVDQHEAAMARGYGTGTGTGTGTDASPGHSGRAVALSPEEAYLVAAKVCEESKRRDASDRAERQRLLAEQKRVADEERAAQQQRALEQQRRLAEERRVAMMAAQEQARAAAARAAAEGAPVQAQAGVPVLSSTVIAPPPQNPQNPSGGAQ